MRSSFLGNHSSTQYPDVNHGFISDYPTDGVHDGIRAVINDDKWLRDTFIPAVQKRGEAVIKARKLSSAASAATAIADHLRDWVLGTPTVSTPFPARRKIAKEPTFVPL